MSDYHIIEDEVDALKRHAQSLVDGAVRAKRDLSDSERNEHEHIRGQVEAKQQIAKQLREDELTKLRGLIQTEDSTTHADPSFRTYSHGERMFASSGPDDDFSLGGFLRGVVTGKKDGIGEATKRALSEGSDGAGGYIVPATYAGYAIDLARAQSTVLKAGAVTVPFEGESFRIGRVLTDPSVAFYAENAEIDASGDPTFTSVQFVPNKMVCIVHCSRELINDATNAAALLEQVLTGALAAKLDATCLEGDGAGTSPSGMAVWTASGGTTTIGEVNMSGTSSGVTPTAALAQSQLTQAIYKPAYANFTTNAIISHPRTKCSWDSLQASGSGWPLPYGTAYANLPWYLTPQISIARTSSNGSGSVTSNLYVGDFTKLLIGMRQSLELYSTRDFKLDYDQVSFFASMRVDVQPTNPAAFARLVDIKG